MAQRVLAQMKTYLKQCHSGGYGGKYIIDLTLSSTGEATIVVDYSNDSMSNMELNDLVSSGELNDLATAQVEKLLGSEIAGQIRAGGIKLVCLDHLDPKEREKALESMKLKGEEKKPVQKPAQVESPVTPQVPQRQAIRQ